jgi:hypothetical protein
MMINPMYKDYTLSLKKTILFQAGDLIEIKIRCINGAPNVFDCIIP